VLLSPAAQFGARRQRARHLVRDPTQDDGDGDGGRGLSLEGRDGVGGVAVAVGGGGLAGY
jgi:hypothetical protein